MSEAPTTNEPNKKLIGYINAAPSWENMLPLYIELLSQGTMKGVMEARSELLRMAKLADAYVASVQEMKEAAQ